MFKTFKLVDKREEQFSAYEGKMTFHLIDELGVERSVWGQTQLNKDLDAISIKSLNSREHPLIQCLFLTNVNDKVTIEFTQYNDVFERKETVSEIKSINDVEKLAREMQNKPMRVGKLLKFQELNGLEKTS